MTGYRLTLIIVCGFAAGLAIGVAAGQKTRAGGNRMA